MPPYLGKASSNSRFFKYRDTDDVFPNTITDLTEMVLDNYAPVYGILSSKYAKISDNIVLPFDSEEPIMKKRIIGILLCAVFMLALFSALSFHAEESIKDALVNKDQPIQGPHETDENENTEQTFSESSETNESEQEPILLPIPTVSIFGIAVPLPNTEPANANSFITVDNTYTIIDSRWTLADDRDTVATFETGKKYTLYITCAPADGYTFSDTAATFNGKAALCGENPGEWYCSFICGAYNGKDCTGDGTICPAAQFSDVPKYGNWAHVGVDYCVAEGLMNGIGGEKFNPNGSVSRAQLVTILYRVAESPHVDFKGVFADVPNGKWYSNAIEWAAANGIVNGTSSNTFSPNGNITREQIATILFRYWNSPTKKGTLNSYPDAGSVSDYAVSAMSWATAEGLLNGVKSGSSTSLSPKSNATRAQIAAIIMRCVELHEQIYHHDETPLYFKITNNYDLYFGNTKQEIPVACIDSRPYVAKDVLSSLPITQISEEALNNELYWPEMLHLDHYYITLADAAALYHLGVEFRESDSSIHLYKMNKPTWNSSIRDSTSKNAYLRLEDIMADYGTNGRFTHNNLIKLRLMGDYLGTCTNNFYIAWIPLYVNPQKDITNNVSTCFNFYNTDFVFTLDTLVRNGGLLGLHGLTHQSGNDISADGFEFGKTITYTTEELLDRFRSAEEIAHRLGYDYYFFEFSHYDATEEQKQAAESFFDAVFQARDGGGFISRKYTFQHNCLWIPTPADYVHSAYDLPGITQLLDESHAKGYDISLFFHPNLDYDRMYVSISGDTMTCSFDESSSIIGSIIQQIGQWGYAFGPFSN